MRTRRQLLKDVRNSAAAIALASCSRTSQEPERPLSHLGEWELIINPYVPKADVDDRIYIDEEEITMRNGGKATFTQDSRFPEKYKAKVQGRKKAYNIVLVSPDVMILDVDAYKIQGTQEDSLDSLSDLEGTWEIGKRTSKDIGKVILEINKNIIKTTIVPRNRTLARKIATQTKIGNVYLLKQAPSKAKMAPVMPIKLKDGTLTMYEGSWWFGEFHKKN